MHSSILDLDYEITARSGATGRPVRLLFSDGVEYDREEMDLLESADDETKRQLHLIKKTLTGILVKFDEVI